MWYTLTEKQSTHGGNLLFLTSVLSPFCRFLASYGITSHKKFHTFKFAVHKRQLATYAAILVTSESIRIRNGRAERNVVYSVYVTAQTAFTCIILSYYSLRVNRGRAQNSCLITNERTHLSLLCALSLRTSMDVGNQSTGVPIQRLDDCHYLISGDLVRINVDRLRRLVALTNRSFYPRDKSPTRHISNATIKMASRDKRCM